MFNVLICDDDIYTVKVISKVIQEIEYITDIYISSNGQEAVEIAQNTNVDLVILDVDMPILNGLDAAKKIVEMNENVKIIFISAYADYAYKSYEIKAVDYILKPIDFNRLKENVEQIVEKLDSVKFEKFIVNNAIFVIKRGLEFLFLDMGDINFIEKDKKQIIIHCKEGTYSTTMRLIDVERKLSNQFYRTHKSYIVNLKNVRRIEPFGDTSYVIYFKEGSEVETALITKNKLRNIKF